MYSAGIPRWVFPKNAECAETQNSFFSTIFKAFSNIICKFKLTEYIQN